MKKAFSRRLSVQKSLQFARGLGPAFTETFDLAGLEHQQYLFDGETTDVFFDEDEENRLRDAFRDKLRDRAFLTNYQDELLDTCDTAIDEGEAITERIGDEPVWELHTQFEDLWDEFYPYAWSAWLLGELEQLLEDELTEEQIQKLARPSKATPAMQEQVAVQELQDDLSRKRAEEIAEEFGWMAVYNFDDEPFSDEDYLRRARENETEELPDLDERRREAEQIIQEIDGALLREQALLFHESGYLREQRAAVRDRLTAMHADIYEKMAQQVGYRVEEIILLTTAEIERLLNGELEEGLIEERTDGWTLTVDGASHTLENTARERESAEKEAVTGSVAQEGRAKGTVRIVTSNDDLSTVRKGDILITSMTKPDYLPAIKRAAAVVTDEGGITSHAAIVSRELGIPCIVGTENATDIFSNGDTVVVDSDTGLVRRESDAVQQ